MKKKIHEGDLIAKPGQIYDFEEIKGNLDARGANTKTAFPKLTTIGGNIYASGANTKTSFPKLTTIGGFLNASGANTKTSFPKLDAKNIGSSNAKETCRKSLKKELLRNSLALHDGILSRVVSKKGNVSRVVIVGQTEISYVIEKDGVTAHGATLSLARADLLFKLGKRDTSIYKSWRLKTEKPLEEMIAAYRAITGACKGGVEHFLSQKKYPKKVSVAFALKETRGKYGHQEFARFFGGGENPAIETVDRGRKRKMSGSAKLL